MIKHDRISINSSKKKKKKTDQHKKLKNEKNGFSQGRVLPWTIIERNNFNSYQSHVVSRRIHRLSLVPLA